MNSKNLLPSIEIAHHIDAKTGEVKAAAYRQGIPRQYRFNANKGNLNLNGEQSLTKAGETIQLLPLCVRIFKDNLFEMGRKTWAELYFLNTANQVCVTMFHGYSVENLEKGILDLFYDEVNLSEVILTVTPIEKTKKEGEGKGSKYYIAEFTYEVLPNEDRLANKLLGESLKVWRADTLTGNSTVELSVNYHPPIQIIEESIHEEEIPELGEVALKN